MKKKRWIRKIILGGILVAVAVAGLLSLQIEPADYRRSLQDDIKSANTLLESVKVGNEKGQYAPQRVLLFEQDIAAAKTVVDDQEQVYEQLKAAAEKLQEQQKDFKRAQNKDCLSQEKVEQIAQKKEDFTKDVSFEGGTATWRLRGSTIEQPAAVNLEIQKQSAYAQQIEALLVAEQSQRQTVTFLHDGALPAGTTVELPCSWDLPAIQVYRYDPESGALGPMIKGTVTAGKLQLPLQSGGSYILIKMSVEEPQPETPRPADPVGSEAAQESSSGASQSSPSSSAQPSSGTPNSGQSSSQQAPDGTPAPAPVEPEAPPAPANTCTLEIRCDTLASDMSKLKNPALAGYVPASGVILGTTQVEITPGETVFDILKRVTRNSGIQMEFRRDGGYTGGVYIEGINHLYEFDGGELSGWMYSVNGWFPNYGCAAYEVQNGDRILWCYTCDLGSDVGAYF